MCDLSIGTAASLGRLQAECDSLLPIISKGPVWALWVTRRCCAQEFRREVQILLRIQMIQSTETVILASKPRSDPLDHVSELGEVV